MYIFFETKKSTMIKRGKKYCQDLRRQTPQTRFIVDIYVLKTMIYCRNQVSLRKSWFFVSYFFCKHSAVSYQLEGGIRRIKSPTQERWSANGK